MQHAHSICLVAFFFAASAASPSFAQRGGDWGGFRGGPGGGDYGGFRGGYGRFGGFRGGYGGFGSTQSTILALKALIAHTKANKKTPEGGTLTLFVNNQKAGETVFAPGAQDAVTVELKNPEKILKVGDNTLRLELTTQRAYPFTLGWSYQSLAPNSAENCAVKLTTALSKTQVREGETSEDHPRRVCR